MADIIESEAAARPRALIKRFLDMGDGTFAEVVAVVAGDPLEVTVNVAPEIEIKNDSGNPVPTSDALGGTRTYDWTNNVRTAVGVASTAAAALPTLSASREVMVHASQRCFVRLGASDLAAASAGAGQLIVEPGERFHFRVNAGHTHFRVIRDTLDGFVTITAVV